MIEKTTCKYCGWEFPIGFLQLITENSDSVFCENCGTELINENFISDTIKNEENSIQDFNIKTPNKKKAIFNRIYENIRIEKSPINRVLMDSDFPKVFKDNFKIVISRVIYSHLRAWELESAIDIKLVELTKDILDKLYNEINPVLTMRIKREYLGNLHKTSIKDFEEWFRMLQTKLKSNKRYHQDYIIYLRRLIMEVYIIVSEFWDVRDLPKFERIIRDDLKCFSFSAEGDKSSKSSKKLNIEKMQKIANDKGGVCLSKKYNNNKSKLKWRCKKGHEWYAMPRSILEGTWCPKCYLDKDGYLKQMLKIAKIRGGECLSKKYINSHSHLKFRCQLGHMWKARPYSIKNGNWCPLCSQGLSERICRNFFEKIFNKKFPQTKFEWLKNVKGNQMHLDGYSPELKLGFEYNGKQHYKFVPYWFETRKIFEMRKLDDELKKKLCEKHNITLIIVPYYVNFDRMGSFIGKKCIEKGINPPNINKNIDWKEFDVYSSKKLIELQEIAKEKGGELISKFYYNNRTKLRFRCDKDHEWEARPYSIKKGNWCPHCYEEYLTIFKKKKENDLKRIIEAKGGEILLNYKNKRSKIKIKCTKGHIWEVLSSDILSGSWCPHCHHNKEYYLNEIKEIAKKRGGECLSNEYKNNKTKLKFRCERGHEWWAKSKIIKEGTWCPDCYRKRI